EELRYPVRTDALVIGKPDQDAANIDLPGDFPRLFVGLDAAQSDKLMLNPLAKLNEAQRQQLQKVLDEFFGSPAHPTVKGIGEDVSQALRLDDATLLRGALEYRHQCLHCHGLTGDGHGPTA